MGNNRYILIFAFLNFISFISCKNASCQDKQDAIDKVQMILQDSISPYGDSIKVYNADSLYAYTPDGVLKYIKYLDLGSPIRLKMYSKDGFLKRIEYNPDNPNSTIVYEEFYLESGNIKRRESIPNSSTNRGVDRLRVHFYENGIIEYVGNYSSIDAQNGPVGLQKYYSKRGCLIKTENYIYPTDDRAYIIETEYYDDGNIKLEKQFYNNEISGSDEIEPKGTWKYYDESGKLIKTERH